MIGSVIKTTITDSDTIYCIEYLNETIIASGGKSSNIRLWNINDGIRRTFQKTNNLNLLSMMLLSDGTLISSGYQNGFLTQLWNFTDKDQNILYSTNKIVKNFAEINERKLSYITSNFRGKNSLDIFDKTSYTIKQLSSDFYTSIECIYNELIIVAKTVPIASKKNSYYIELWNSSTEKLLFSIPNAHNGQITAIKNIHHLQRLVYQAYCQPWIRPQ